MWAPNALFFLVALALLSLQRHPRIGLSIGTLWSYLGRNKTN